jgi:cyclase
MEVFMQQITKNIFVEVEWPGANASYVSTTYGLVLIDTPYYPSHAVEWKKTVESKGNVKYLINTEPHHDHYLGAYFFNIPSIAHERTRESMAATDVKQILAILARNNPEDVPLVKNYKIHLPDITFSERMSIYLGSHSLQLFYMPGHSLGQIAILIPEERVIFTGDNITYKMQGFLHEADPYAWLESLKRIGQLDFNYIVPGHGLPCEKSYLKEETAFVQSCIDKIKEAINKGWSKEESIARVSFETYPLDPRMGIQGKLLLEQSVRHMYEVLS